MLGTRSNVPKRIDTLATTLFGRLDNQIRGLRYQLLHATVAAIISAQANNADVAVFLVYEFASAKLKPEKMARNRQDWTDFVRAVAGTAAPNVVEDNQMIGPLRLPRSGTPALYLAHLVTALPIPVLLEA